MIYYWWCFVCFFQHNSKFVELVISNVCILIYEIVLFLLLIILGRRFEVYKLENIYTQWITCEYCVSISRCRLQISFLIFFSIWKIHKNHESAKICEKWVNLKMYPNWMKFCFRILSQYRFQTKVKVVRKLHISQWGEEELSNCCYSQWEAEKWRAVIWNCILNEFALEGIRESYTVCKK